MRDLNREYCSQQHADVAPQPSRCSAIPNNARVLQCVSINDNVKPLISIRSKDKCTEIGWCGGRRVRVFWFGSGRLRRVYDESLEAAAELQRSDSALARLDPIDFGRRVAIEKELISDAAAPPQNAIFDDSGNFVLYSTLLGIKVPLWPTFA